jgi:hypothetical protein
LFVWLVPLIEPPPASPKASGAVGTVNPAGPAIDGAFARMLVPTFGPELWRNVSSVFKPGFPAITAVPTANCSVVWLAGLTVVVMAGSRPACVAAPEHELAVNPSSRAAHKRSGVRSFTLFT